MFAVNDIVNFLDFQPVKAWNGLLEIQEKMLRGIVVSVFADENDAGVDIDYEGEILYGIDARDVWKVN